MVIGLKPREESNNTQFNVDYSLSYLGITKVFLNTFEACQNQLKSSQKEALEQVMFQQPLGCPWSYL